MCVPFTFDVTTENLSLSSIGQNAPEDDTSKAIAKHLIEFLQMEVEAGRLPKNLLPLQSGIGNVANSIIGSFSAQTAAK